MESLLFEELVKRLNTVFTKDGELATDIGGFGFFRSCEPSEFTTAIYEPSLCIAVQGTKAVGFGDELFSYSPSTYLLSSVYMPLKVRIEKASTALPYYAIVLKFSMEEIFEAIKDMDNSGIKISSKPERGLYFGDMNIRLLEPLTRLVRLLDNPKDIPVLAPLIKKEILYIVMQGRGGDFIRQYIVDGSTTQRVVEAITKIKDNFREKLNFENMAKTIGMSESSLYHSFKKVTAMTPLEFQKSLRLREAKQMLLNQNTSAAEVAFAVGYESPSHFSREYARMFGLPPKADAKASKRL
ncbi:MAG: AraC family transcriptional regulator [Campylobacterales bacterium]